MSANSVSNRRSGWFLLRFSLETLSDTTTSPFAPPPTAHLCRSSAALTLCPVSSYWTCHLPFRLTPAPSYLVNIPHYTPLRHQMVSDVLENGSGMREGQEEPLDAAPSSRFVSVAVAFPVLLYSQSHRATPSRVGLLPPFGTHKTSHLPTPQRSVSSHMYRTRWAVRVRVWRVAVSDPLFRRQTLRTWFPPSGLGGPLLQLECLY